MLYIYNYLALYIDNNANNMLRSGKNFTARAKNK